MKTKSLGDGYPKKAIEKTVLRFAGSRTLSHGLHPKRLSDRAGERSLDVMRWGLVPFWAKDIKVGFANINAKAEGIENRPAFRDAFERRRCLVPVDNFYEWKKTATGSSPMRWRSRTGG